MHNALQSTPGPGFLVKLNPDASQTVWSAYFREAVNALAVDSSGNVYVTGSTHDTQFPVTPGLPNGPVAQGLGQITGAFVTKISGTGDRILYSGVISGSNKPCGCCSSCFTSPRNTTGVSIAVDAAGNAYLAGNTDTSNIPTTSGALLATGTGAFVSKMKADGSGLVYLTYIGPTNYPLAPNTNPANTAAAVACDAAGNAYVAGSTSDPKFPATSGAYQPVFGGPANSNSPTGPPTDAFALKLNPTGTAVLWASYLGGTGVDAANSIAVDASNQVWIAGTTASQTFPNAQGWSQGSDFVAGFDATGAKLIHSSRFPNDAGSRAVAVDASGLLHIAGPTGFVSTIPSNGTPQMRIFGVANAAAGPLNGQIAGGEVISIYGPHIGPSTPVIATADASGNLPGALNGYQVVARNVAALPLLYLSDSQINAIVPFGVYQNASLAVITPSGTTPDFSVSVVPAVPEIFRNPDGTAVAVNQDGTLNSLANPAPNGSYVSIWATGAHLPIPGSAGQIATAANNYLCCGLQLGYRLAPVSYAGTAPGAALGVVQMNFQIATDPVYGNFGSPVPVRVIANDGSMSRPASVYVH